MELTLSLSNSSPPPYTIINKLVIEISLIWIAVLLRQIDAY